jgi:FixJ family two-component response regulator
MSGPDLQQELIRRRQKIPIVSITGAGDHTVRLRVLAQGAVQYLSKVPRFDEVSMPTMLTGTS